MFFVFFSCICARIEGVRSLKNIRHISCLAALDSKQLPFSKHFSQFKNTYDASKEASNQQLQVGVPSVSIKLNFISNTDKQSTSQESSRVKNTAQSLRQIEQK